MCDTCAELDDKIAHYQRIAMYITDQLTLDGLKKLIERASTEKAALHPEHEAASAGAHFKSRS